MTLRVRVAKDPDAICRRLAADLSEGARTARSTRGRFRLVLSGGSTPRPLYRLLAGQGPGGLPWGEVEVFWGDERCVSPQDPESNYREARADLLDKVPVPGDHLHRIPGEAPTAEEAALRYEEELSRSLGSETPDFDYVLLGMGKDGHTASLFPGQPLEGEPGRRTVAVPHPGQPPFVPRVSLTRTCLSSSREVGVLVTGSEKAERVAQVLRSLPSGDPNLPVSQIRSAGNLTWYLDAPAASRSQELLPSLSAEVDS